MHRKTLHHILIIFLILLSCSNMPDNEEVLSYRGFYYSPEEIIAEFKNDNRNYKKNFLRAVALKKLKNYKKSLRFFANSCFENYTDFKIEILNGKIVNFISKSKSKSEYYNDAVYEIADIYYMYKKYNYAFEILNKISKSHRSLYFKAALLKAKISAATGDNNNALSILMNGLKQFSDNNSRLLLYIRIGSLLEKTGKNRKSFEYYLKVIDSDFKSWKSSIAAKRIKYLIDKSLIKIKNDRIKFKLARVFFRNRYYKNASAQLAGIKNRSGEEYKILLTKLSVRMNNIRLIKAILAKTEKRSGQYYNLIRTWADELWKLNKKKTSIPVYYRLAKSKKKPHRQHALKRISLYKLKIQARGYRKELIGFVNNYPDDPLSGYFLRAMARNSILNKNKDAAVFLNRYIKNFPSGKHSGYCRYWLYKSYLKSGKVKKATALFRELIIENPDSSYTWRAIKINIKKYRLKDLKKRYKESKKQNRLKETLFYSNLIFLKDRDFAARDKRLNELNIAQLYKYKKIYTKLKNKTFSIGKKNFKLLENYFKIGYSRGIRRELNRISSDPAYEKDRFFALAYLADKYKHSFLLVHSIQSILKANSLKENIFIMPIKLLKMLYPLSFKDCIAKFSSEYKVSIYLIYSIIKSESLFKHNALSRAGATGLMQILPSTAKTIAKNLKIKGYKLTSPCISIQFGAKYIAWLKKYFNNDLYYSTAAYNAGIGNVKKWRKRIKSNDIDFFIEFIPYSETRNYVLRTDKFLSCYELIYK